jgi:hypothetical protein
MVGKEKRRTGLRTLLLGAAVLGLGSNEARAYFGFGIGAFNYVPSPGDFLNQHALSNASRARGPVNNSVYAGNPNSYLSRIRDNGFVPSYDVSRRVPPAQRPYPVMRTAAVPAPTQTANPVPQPVVPLPSFFNAERQLVWPSDAPVAGDLQRKRDISDQSSLVVLAELQTQGRASTTSVADSRQKLLDYGQPALQKIRATSTVRLADAFHLFLLSLYESLAQAANPLAASP